jgi:predicted transcriptional regulator
MYHITDYSKQKAKQLNVDIKPSNKKNKKIDVIKNNKIIASIGDVRYNDYPTYIMSNGLIYADKRKKLYKIRHKKDLKVKNSAGFYADKILW